MADAPSPSFFLQEHPSFEKFSHELFSLLMDLTKLSNTLPTEEDYNYYSSFRPFKNKISGAGAQVLSMTQKFLEYESSLVPKFTEYEDVDEVVDNFPQIVDVVDGMIERVDAYADEVTGVQNAQATAIISKSKIMNQKTNTGDREYNLFYSSTLHRPQLKFADPPDNSNQPFVPKITSKPNAQVPFQDYIDKVRARAPDSFDSYPHPYEYEIDNYKYPRRLLEPRKEIMYNKLEDTPLTWIDTPERLQALIQLLSRETEFAIDLENHHYRSFQGFVCLMQISTRKEDFLIDTLKLREQLSSFLPVFTNPNIIKVLHGSDSDIVWLQRDFGLYIVNLFDTGQAARVLEFPSASLAHSLHHFCGIVANKKYQLADWRIRPIPEEMLRYAQEDTHYLLYIYDRLHNELLSKGKNLLLTALNRSRDISKRRYEKELLFDNSYTMLLNKSYVSLNPKQLRALRALYEWRDDIARQEDESINYVLPNHMLVKIAATIPTDVPSLLGCCSSVPPHVTINATDILYLLRTAVNQSSPERKTKAIRLPKIGRQRSDEQESHHQLPKQTPTHYRRDSDSHSESPVLSAEQLFPYAGWLENKNKTHSFVPRQAALSPHAASSKLFGYSLNDAFEPRNDILQHIHSSFSGTPLFTLLTPMKGVSGDKTAHGQQLPEEPQMSNQTFDMDVDHSHPHLDNPPDTPSVPPAEPESETNVPRSIHEIYKLSNKNRKRNKEKKKLKESIKKGDGAHYEEHSSDEEANSPKRQRPNAGASSGGAPSHDTQDFMRKIGWIDKKNTEKTNTFVPFDYTKASFGEASTSNGSGFSNNQNLEGYSNNASQSFRARTVRYKHASKSVTTHSQNNNNNNNSNWRR